MRRKTCRLFARFRELLFYRRGGVLDRPSKISLIAVSTAILFGSLATAFVYYAQNNYRIRSGGMPYFETTTA